MINILAIGDVVGNESCEFLARVLPGYKRLKAINFTIANGENSADGNGVSKKSAATLFSAGIDEGLFGFAFAAVAGIMVFVSLHELLPSAYKYGSHRQIMKGLFAGMIVIAFSLIFFGE